MDIFDVSTNNFGSVVRLHRIHMKNFRNIEDSSITFPDTKLSDVIEGNPSILGIYGQNGSGKTSVIMALGLLKNLLSGNQITKRYESCIRYGCDRATLTFDFCITRHYKDDNTTDVGVFYSTVLDNSRMEVSYQVDITTDIRKREKNDETIVQIENEQLFIKCIDADNNVVFPKQVFVDTSESACTGKMQAFGNKTKFKLLTSDDEDLQMELFKSKAVSKADSESFLFSYDFITMLYDKYNEEVEMQKEFFNRISDVYAEFFKVMQLPESEQDNYPVDEFLDKVRDAMREGNDIFSLGITGSEIDSANDDELLDLFLKLLNNPAYKDSGIKGYFFAALGNLILFAEDKLHVVDTFSMGIINVNSILPLYLKVKKHNKLSDCYESSYQKIDLNMDEPTPIDDDSFASVDASIKSLSSVLETIIPGLHLELKDYGVRIENDGSKKRIIDVIACRDDVSIPIKFESDGIRRLISILSPMVGAYNDPSITLAVDEIDSGIFEFLLGEVIQIMSSSCKGQLIFTSHNLRPLEVLPSKFLAFTTINAKNRYTSIAARGNSNLRDTYFRSIVLGTKADDVYRSTDPFDIEQAFILAGE